MTETRKLNWLESFRNGRKRPVEAPESAPAKRRETLTPTTTLSSSVKEPVTHKADSAGDAVSELTGRISKFVSGRGATAIVQFQTNDDRLLMLSGLRVLPVVDKGFEYRIKVRRLVGTGTAKMEIISMLEPAMVPLPVSGFELRERLWHGLKMTAHDATRIALEVCAPFFNETTATYKPLPRLRTAMIPIEHLFQHHSQEDWFHKLGGSWKPIQFRNFPLLCKFWTYWDLQDLHLDELQQLVDALKKDPLPFFLQGQTDTGLPPIPIGKAHLLEPLLGTKLTPDHVRLISYYNAIYNQFGFQKTLCIFRNDIANINCGLNPQEKQDVLSKIAVTSGMSAAKRKENYNLFVVTYEPGFGAGYYHRKIDYDNKKLLQRRLGFLIGSRPDCVDKNARFGSVQLTRDQANCVDRIVNHQNIMLLIGDAGTGKTHVGRVVFDSFLPKSVLPVAMYGEVANKMRRVYGKGMTIDMCLERIRRETKIGIFLRDNTEVLIIDEIGVVTEDKLAALIAALPNLKKLFMMGDFKQLRPVSAGAVLDSMMHKWADTPLIHVLTQNHRVDENSQVLLENYRAYINGDIKSIQYTNAYIAVNPFHVIQRINYPDSCHFPKNGDLANHHRRMLLMKSELEPIRNALITQGKDLRSVRILAQRGDDVKKLNQAWFLLENAGKNLEYSETIFYKGSVVCFQKNMNFKKYDWTDQIACSPVSNNTNACIKEIYDVNPRCKKEKAMATRKICESTSSKKYNEKWLRVIVFEDDTQINLRDYPLRWLAYGYAGTVASSIGFECNTVIGWIQPGHVHVYRETLYTLMTRAKELVYLICDFNGDPTLHNSDIGWIYRKPAPDIENILINYLPRYGEVNELSESSEHTPAVHHAFPLAREINIEGLGFELSDSDDQNWQGEENDEESSAGFSNISHSNADQGFFSNAAFELFEQASQGAFANVLTNTRTATMSSPSHEIELQQFNSNW